jgi:hypothetical protein
MDNIMNINKARSLGGKIFSLPTTSLCAVVWFRDSVKYRGILPTPRSNDELQQIMLKRGCAWRMIGGVYPHVPMVPRRD